MNRWALPRVNRIGFIVAILLGTCVGLYWGQHSPDIYLHVFIVVIACAVVSVKKRNWLLLVLFLLGCTAGVLRGSTYMQSVQKYNHYFDKPVKVAGKVSDDPGYSEDKQTEFHIDAVVINGEKLPGRVRIRARGANSVGRGDRVAASGTLRRTLGTGRQGALSYATVTVLHKNTGLVELVRSRFFAAVYSSLPEPQASLGLGYLVGVRTALPADFATALSVVGLTHIVAVSGYNLTIIVQFVKRLFENVSAYQTVLFSFVLIAGFLLMTGWSPSIMRAAIISGLSLLAWYYGRSFHPLVIILIGAAVTGFISPLYIWGDVGWYLSFLAFTGVLLVAPLAMYFLGSVSRNILFAILIETLSAQLLTLPYIALIFGRVSIISPIANVLVIPLIPLAMLLVFIIGIVGIASPIAALWIAFPAKILMSYSVFVVEKLAIIPWAQRSIALSVWQVAVAYVLMAVVTLLGWIIYNRRVRSGADSIDWNLL